MKAHVRLVKTRDNSLIHYADYTYTGKNLRYSDWAGHNGERLVQALEHGYEALGHDISDSLFLLYPYAERSDNGEQTCGLAPLAPAEEATASSRAPKLEWQSFPREADKLAAPNDIARIKNVKYDLIVGTGGNNESFDVVYRREGLPKPSHRLEMPLQPDTRYFWSVRARFTLDGRQRVTEWGTRCPFEPQLTVSWQLYRFYTPGE
jgi:hypothetical protein